jgi:hypothetical protein
MMLGIESQRSRLAARIKRRLRCSNEIGENSSYSASVRRVEYSKGALDSANNEGELLCCMKI